MNTDTPETDAKASPHIGFYSCATVPAEFARKLERERDEAREDAAHWKTEYLIVAARLCGKKHPRDNGIISEHEIIPKLERERDSWEQTAAHYLDGMHYYRGLVQEIGETIGEAACLQDDGGKVDSVLCAKVPELVVDLKRERDEARELAQELLDALSKLVALNAEMTSDDCTYERAYYCYYKGHYDKWKLATEALAKAKEGAK